MQGIEYQQQQSLRTALRETRDGAAAGGCSAERQKGRLHEAHVLDPASSVHVRSARGKQKEAAKKSHKNNPGLAGRGSESHSNDHPNPPSSSRFEFAGVFSGRRGSRGPGSVWRTLWCVV